MSMKRTHKEDTNQIANQDQVMQVQLHNPYPAWQAVAGETCCWNCYRVVMTKQEADCHVCTVCADDATRRNVEFTAIS